MATRRLPPIDVLLVLVAIAGGVAILVGAYTLPVYGCSGDCPSGSDTLMAENGNGVLVVVAAPLVASLLCLALLGAYRRLALPWARPVAGVVAGLLWVLALLGLMTIGVAIVPVAFLLTVAVAKAPPPAVAHPGVG